MKNTENTFRKGSIFLTQFPFTDLKQSKIRPVVVISCDEAYDDVIVMAISSVTSRRDLSNTIILSPADAEFSETGLKKESCILVHRIATIKKDRLFYRLGNLAQRFMEDIDKLVLRKFEIGAEEKQKQKSIPYGKQSVDTSDIFSVIKALRSDWLTTGPKVAEFEEAVAKYVGVKHAVAVSSGTAALHCAMYALEIGPGDEVIVSPMTFAASANCVVYQGGTPVFADVESDTLLLDPEQVELKIAPNTKAIIAVDYTGQPCDYDALRKIAVKNNLVLVADACHALGAEYKGRKSGSLADLNIFSFHPVKHITTGEGGMILTDNEEFYEKLKIFRHHGIVKNNPEEGPWHYEIHELGYNLRLTDFQCALGISQMRKLDGFIERRREIAAMYNRAFAGIEEVILPTEKEYAKVSYHIYVIQLRPEMLMVGRKEIFEALRAENIGVHVHYLPVHLHPFYQRRFGYKKGDYPVAESYYERAITLPIFPKMADQDVQDVISAVKKVITYYSRRHLEV